MSKQLESNEEAIDYQFKVVIIGDSDTGKTSLVAQYVSKMFSVESESTIGVDFSFKTLRVSQGVVRLELWDTAGQERFRALSSAYYRGCHGIVLVYDIGKRSSFENICNWLDEVAIYTNRQHLPILLLGNKLDTGHREVTRNEATKLALNEAMSFAETSAKSGECVDEAFGILIRILFQSPFAMQMAAKKHKPVSLEQIRERNACVKC